jgi:hypothetical protein
MVDQATMSASNGAGVSRDAKNETSSGRAPSTPDPATGAGQVVSNVADFGENLLNLAELQVRMSAMELRQNAQSLRSVAALFLSGSLLALASLPVVLAGVAELLVTELGFRRGYAFLAVGFAAFGLGALGAALAAVWLGRKDLGFPLSADEFTRNLNWARAAIRRTGRQRAPRS